jgi:hypothetical protein
MFSIVYYSVYTNWYIGRAKEQPLLTKVKASYLLFPNGVSHGFLNLSSGKNPKPNLQPNIQL